MKRALLAVLAALLCLSLASCITINIPSNMVPGETVTQQPVETDPVTEAPTDDTTGSQTPDQPQVSYTDIVKGFDATIEETVLLDDRDVKVTATDLRFEDGTAYLTVKAENNTDMKLIFIAGSSYYNLNSINGYMVGNGYLYEKIEAGESKDLEMEFGMGEMIAYGIRNIAEIGTGFLIEEEDLTRYIETGPLSVRTSAAADYDYSLDSFARVMDNGQTPEMLSLSVKKSYSGVLDNSYITAESVYLAERDGSPYLFIELRNKSDKDLTYYISDVSVNGLMVSSGTWYSTSITHGKKCLLSIAPDRVLSEEYRNVLGIDSFATVDFGIATRDFETYGLYTSDDIKLTIGEGSQYECTGEILYSGNKVTIRAAGMFEDPSESYSDVHMLLIVRNDNSFGVDIDDDSATVNGNENGCYMFYLTLKPGKLALMDVELDGDDLDEDGIDLQSITEVKVKFEIEDDSYNTLDEPVITFIPSK